MAAVVQLPHYGATLEEWNHFSLILGLTADTLPVIANPKATISIASKLKQLGKVPSTYNQAGFAVGFADWTNHVTTSAEITKWSRERDLGICLQTRSVRALDVDIEDGATGTAILAMLPTLPRRERKGSNKFLCVFTLPGDYSKRILKTAHGAIEFLANGQQFVACGTHVGGERYQWAGGLPEEIPRLEPEEFERLWQALEERFAIEPSVERNASTKTAKLSEAAANDETAQALHSRSLVLGAERDGRLHIRCPFEDSHTTESAVSATSYFPANTGGYSKGHFKCFHAHCEKRSDEEFRQALGIASMADDFGPVDARAPAAGDVVQESPARFQAIQAATFATAAPERWLIRDVLPEADLAVLYGESGSGKSFLALDMVAAIARGVAWRDFKTAKGRGVYVVAEGVGGFRKRLRAYAQAHDIEGLQLDLYVIADVPNLMLAPDVKGLIASIRAVGEVKLVVVDTLARTMVGGEENSAQDIGKVLAHCAQITKHTGAMVMLVHHSGKDATKGARGSSALRAGADAEFEVVRADRERVVTVSKLKDEEDAAELGFRLQTVMVGVDEEGEDITSCVVEHVQAVPRAQRKREPKGANERALWRLLHDLADLGATRLHYTELIEKAVSSLPYNPLTDGRDRRGEYMKKAFLSLQAGGMVVLEEGSYVVLVGA